MTIIDVNSLNFTGTLSVVSSVFNDTAPGNAVLSGLTGACTFTQPEQGTATKRVIIHCASLVPSLGPGTATITFPTAFTFTPVVLTTSGLSSSLVTTLNTTTAIITTSTVTTGFIIIEGF